MTNPCLPSNVTNTIHKDVFLGKHVVVGSGSVVLPGVTLGDGCSVGALSLVNKSVDEFKVIVGVPAKVIKDRKRNILDLEKKINK
jgi:galactoside O-acetyltransferase